MTLCHLSIALLGLTMYQMEVGPARPSVMNDLNI
jgi:hypothetical protein